jgi:hypothetical protein
MSRTEVFDPVKEVSKLKERVSQLEQQIQALQQRVIEGPPTFGPLNWTIPKGPSDFPFGIKWTAEESKID